MEIAVYNKEGKKTGATQLPDHIFNLPPNNALVYQVFTVQQKSQYRPYAHTKTRAEVRGGGIKPWRQKGTGRARHGSIRSPLWVGGGITFGPRNIQAKYKINNKMRKKAVATILSDHVRLGSLLVIDSLAFGEPKTKQAANFLSVLKKKDASNLVLGSEGDANFVRVFRNITGAKAMQVQNLNVLDLLNNKNCIISLDALKFLINSYANTAKHIQEGGQQTQASPRQKAGTRGVGRKAKVQTA